ncbi:uncharacterized protein PFL1_04031 [Pseudozyma flocculosa PF-1]|uniref:Uncharacterized protein n=2 Tax=Pseudozyma flocculosa TaxID=84751 RepID=A0A5C3EVZ2_9BASI|nr:uncharacterized protein PFL1_04031 [Pseudozyma flocculosa PF-1]EPQ28203.1 hypothetical protein PFL1_04031 [Pseudozyma flocculosa PF-1]SPO35339.1 uncharacterized protein PSFLO_00810 [Pseudozyma flocculosa]
MAGQPATAAIVVAAIFGALAVLFFSYRIYRKVWNHRHRDQLLPPVREPPTAYYGQSAVTPMAQASPYSFFAQANGTGSKGSSIAVPSPSYNGAATPNELPSPSTPAADLNLTDAGPMPEPYDAHGRGYSTVSSSSSTMTLKRSYASGLPKPSSASVHSALSTPSMGRRESYLPHSPLNRDQIQIVPPQPLGFGTGGFAMATDQRTLAFSKMSGIGAGEDLTSGLVWADNNEPLHTPGGTATASAQPHQQPHQQQPRDDSRRPSKAQLGEDERRKYLLQGPGSRSASPALPPPAASPSPASRRALSPGGSSLASNSRGTSALSDRSSNSDDPSTRGEPRRPPPGSGIDARALDESKSPLQRVVSDRLPVPHARMPSEVPSDETDHSGSPILGAFRTLSPATSRPSPQPSPQRSARPSPPDTGAGVRVLPPPPPPPVA